MKKRPEFVDSYLQEAEKLLQTKAVKEPIFSRGTYQIEVHQRGKNRVFQQKMTGCTYLHCSVIPLFVAHNHSQH